mmetsp:Transcript_2336/g.9350  ORF Transcript_2336/g.9350 Transcript_2336/m.9350 type:complete len:447 (+) Transcript_2336:831-2171(+)
MAVSKSRAPSAHSKRTSGCSTCRMSMRTCLCSMARRAAASPAHSTNARVSASLAVSEPKHSASMPYELSRRPFIQLRKQAEDTPSMSWYSPASMALAFCSSTVPRPPPSITATSRPLMASAESSGSLSCRRLIHTLCKWRTVASNGMSSQSASRLRLALSTFAPAVLSERCSRWTTSNVWKTTRRRSNAAFTSTESELCTHTPFTSVHANAPRMNPSKDCVYVAIHACSCGSRWNGVMIQRTVPIAASCPSWQAMVSAAVAKKPHSRKVSSGCTASVACVNAARCAMNARGERRTNLYRQLAEPSLDAGTRCSEPNRHCNTAGSAGTTSPYRGARPSSSCASLSITGFDDHMHPATPCTACVMASTSCVVMRAASRRSYTPAIPPANTVVASSSASAARALWPASTAASARAPTSATARICSSNARAASDGLIPARTRVRSTSLWR